MSPKRNRLASFGGRFLLRKETMQSLETAPCNVCSRKMERPIWPDPPIHGQFSMCSACAQSYKRDLFNEGLINSNTHLEDGITWLVLASIEKLLKLFPSATVPIPEPPPTLKSIDIVLDEPWSPAPVPVPTSTVCPKHYYGIGNCTCKPRPNKR